MPNKLHIETWVDDVYLNNDLLGMFGTNSYDVEAHHIEREEVRQWVKNYSGRVWVKFAGPISAEKTAEYAKLWQIHAGSKLQGFIQPDEPKIYGYTVEQYEAMYAAIKGVCKLPVLVNLCASPDDAPFINPRVADIFSTSGYFNVEESGKPHTEQDVRGAMRWLKQTFINSGLSRSTGHALGFVVQMFRHMAYKDNVERLGVPFGDGMFGLYQRLLWEELGADLTWLSLYAARPIDVFDGDMPNLHPEMWPPIQRFTAALASDENLSPLYAIDGEIAPPPPLPSALPDIVIEGKLTEFTFFVAQDRYAREAEFEVAVDGVALKKNVRVDEKAIRKNDVWQKVVVRHTASQSKHTLTIRFTNDAYDGPGKDLNLYVRKAAQDGVAMKELSAGALYYPGQSATFETAEGA